MPQGPGQLFKEIFLDAGLQGAQKEVGCDTGLASQPITIILFSKQPITINFFLGNPVVENRFYFYVDFY